jgi:hypothetical protein
LAIPRSKARPDSREDSTNKTTLGILGMLGDWRTRGKFRTLINFD